MSAQRTVGPSGAQSQSLSVELSSPPTYWIGLETDGSFDSRRGKTESGAVSEGSPCVSGPATVTTHLAGSGTGTKEPAYARVGGAADSTGAGLRPRGGGSAAGRARWMRARVESRPRLRR